LSGDLMATAEDRIQFLLELGETDQHGDWPDYLQYSFTEADIPALLDLVVDETFDQANSESNEVWAPLHAWRVLGQLRSSQAIIPLINQFDRLCEDEWALTELSTVMGMLGEPAIEPLAAFLNDPYHKEFARVMALDGLAEIVKHLPACREQVIQCYRDYMHNPDESACVLNGLLIGRLLDLDATEAIDDIRQFFARDCVDITCAGDLEEVEIELGFRRERKTPKPDYAKLYGIDPPDILEKPGSNDVLELLDYYLLRYGHDDSILDISALDGFFAALACAPDTILPSRWIPAIWGSENNSPAWPDEEELGDFTRAVFALYNQVMQGMNEDVYEALFLEHEVDGKTYTIVDDWCEGFLRGLNLWGPLSNDDAAVTEECIQPVRLFAMEEGFSRLEAMRDDEIEAQQKLIEPSVCQLFRHFLAQRRQATAPYIRQGNKVGRNDPCPCGSGKKYKHCCPH
jgi:uncharacterized protein